MILLLSHQEQLNGNNRKKTKNLVKSMVTEDKKLQLGLKWEHLLKRIN